MIYDSLPSAIEMLRPLVEAAPLVSEFISLIFQLASIYRLFKKEEKTRKRTEMI